MGKTAENDSQAQKDRSGYSTSTQHVTGGEFKDLYGEEGSSEVGNSFDDDLMGEKESKVTYKGK